MAEMKTIFQFKFRNKYYGVSIAEPNKGFHKPGVYVRLGGKQYKLIPLWGKANGF